jgi:hypothetical protein
LCSVTTRLSCFLALPVPSITNRYFHWLRSLGLWITLIGTGSRVQGSVSNPLTSCSINQVDLLIQTTGYTIGYSLSLWTRIPSRTRQRILLRLQTRRVIQPIILSNYFLTKLGKSPLQTNLSESADMMQQITKQPTKLH